MTTNPFKTITTATVTYHEDAWPLDVMACLESRPSWVSCAVILRISRCDGGEPGEPFEDMTISFDPDTADRIASAIHVAAAQVRAARGERIAMTSIEDNDPDGACVVIRDESDQCVVFPRFNIQRLISELGAWLAAHPEVAK